MKKSIFLFFAAILCAIGMNAANYLYLKPSSDWKSNNARFAAYFFESGEKWVSMTKVTDDLYRVEIPSGYSKVIFCRMNGSNSTNKWDNKWNQTGNLTINGNTGKVYNINGWGDGSSWGSTVPLYAKNTTLYILPNSDWKNDNARFAVCFLDGSENWVSCTKVGSTDYYSVTIPNSDLIAYAIFCRMNGNNATNNWSNKWNQTNDLAPSSGKNGVEITGWDNSQKWIVVYDQLSVNYTPTTAADAPNISQTLIKDGSSVTVTAPNAKTGYHWVKWTSSNGSFNDQSAQNTNFTPTAKSAVATANYAENTYTVTISASTGGTVSPSGDQTIGQVTKTTVTATANDNYEFANWTATGGVVVANTSAASTTITATAAGTLTANFRSTATYSLTVAEGAGIASVEGSTDTVTLGNTYEIKATSKTGYTFSTWTAEPAANATFADAASATTDVTVLNGSVTVTASATEILAELTTANAFDAGTPSIAAPTASATEIGVATTATVTATPATGYTLASWTLENCVRTDGGAENATTITIKSNGDGAAATVTANYEIDKYYVVGSFNDWTTEDANYEMTYDNGVYKKEVTFAKDVEFKICFGNWNGNWGANNLGGIEYEEIESGSDGNIKLTTGATFTIIFNREKHLITFEGLTRNYDYVLMGVNGDWTTGIAMTVNPDNTDEYTLKNQTIYKSTDAVKVVTLTNGTATAWCGNVDSWSNAKYTTDKDGNIVLEDGIYDFYFKVSGDNIYISQTGYVRNVTIDNYGTICLPKASSSVTGATFYEVSYLVEGQGLWLDQLADGVQLEAGKPYIFKATDSEIKVTYTGEAKDAPVDGENGLTGTFTDIADGGLTGNYIIAENKVWVAGTGATLSANRAYIDATKVPKTAQAQLPGRRRVQMGENAATGLDNITNGENTVIKTIENGQLIIIRNGEKFNAQGIQF